MKKIIVNGYEFRECTAIAFEGDKRQPAVFCHKLDDEFCDGDCVIFGHNLPKDADDVKIIFESYSDIDCDVDVLATVEYC